MKYYLAIKKNESLPFSTTQTDLEGIMLSEISQTEKDKYIDPTDMCNLKKNKGNELKNPKQKQTQPYREQTSVCQRGREWGLGETREGIKRHKLPVIKLLSYRNVMYSMRKAVRKYSMRKAVRKIV